MRVLWTGFIVTGLSLIPSTSWAKSVSCSNLESTSYLNAKSYHYERLRNPFGNWSEGLIPEIEGKFSECLAQYKNKYGEDGFKTKKVIKAKVYFESVREEILDNLKIRQFQNDKSQQFRKDFAQLEETLKKYGIVYSPNKGFTNKKMKLVPDVVMLEHKAEGFKSILPHPLAESDIKSISALVDMIGNLARTHKAFSQENSISLKELGLSSSLEQQLNSATKMPAQFSQYLDEKRFQPFLDTYKIYSINVIQAVDPILNQHQSGKLVLREAVANHNWRAPELFELEQLLEPVIKSHQMLLNRGMNDKVLSDIAPTLAQAVDARDKYQLLHQAIQVAKEENSKAELAEIDKKQQLTEQYISRSKASTIAEQFNSIGYSDAMLSLGRFGNPFDSTYATVQCLSSLYSAVEVVKSGKQVEINFGESGVFGIKSQYTMKLQLVRDYVTQYVPMDFISHEDTASTTGRGKVLHFANLVRQCEKRNGIKLIN